MTFKTVGLIGALLVAGCLPPAPAPSPTPAATPTPKPAPTRSPSGKFVMDEVGMKWIRVRNIGDATASLEGWSLCAHVTYFPLPAVVVEPGRAHVVTYHEKGTATATESFTGTGFDLLENDNVGLYRTDSDFGNSSNVADFVQWGTKGVHDTRVSEAFEARQWDATTSFAPPIPVGGALRYSGTGDAASSWATSSTPLKGR